MRQEDFQVNLKQTFDILTHTLGRKAHDYATEDVLSNFKRVSQVAKLLNINVHTPIGYALFMVLLKIDRICNLIFIEEAPVNEALEDSFVDAMGYLILAENVYSEG